MYHEHQNHSEEIEEQPVDETLEDAVETTDEVEEEAPVELDPLATLELEVAKWKDQAIRTSAELDNYRKRTARDLGEARKYGNRGLLSDLLPILDNFTMGLQAASQDESSMIYLGMKMVKDQLDEFLSSNGVISIDPTGEQFDPNLHEALSQEESADVAEGTIIRTLRLGYTLHDKLIRAANVVVACPNSESDETIDV